MMILEEIRRMDGRGDVQDQPLRRIEGAVQRLPAVQVARLRQNDEVGFAALRKQERRNVSNSFAPFRMLCDLPTGMCPLVENATNVFRSRPRRPLSSLAKILDRNQFRSVHKKCRVNPDMKRDKARLGIDTACCGSRFKASPGRHSVGEHSQNIQGVPRSASFDIDHEFPR
jgi:hypothetical protein